jgi:hypothetical protein
MNGGVTNVERRLTGAFSAATFVAWHCCLHQPLERRATMRNLFISLAVGASALAVAAPAAAQPYSQPYARPQGQWVAPSYRYAPYNYGYGYNGYNFVRSMQGRVQRIRGDIRNMEMRRILSYREARRLDNEARAVERRIYQSPRGGIRPAEARGIENRIRKLEVHVMREANDWNRRAGHYRRYW